MKCIHCKAENPDFIIYCQSCGNYVASGNSTEYGDIFKSLLLGLMGYLLVYQIILPLLDFPYLKQLFAGIICETITVVSLWTLFLLGFKALRHRGQLRSFLPFYRLEMKRILKDGIYVKNIEQKLTEISRLMQKEKVKHLSNSLIYRRIHRLFFHIMAIPQKEEIKPILTYQGDIDYNRMESGYTILAVFIWSIPILGFIGTVYGIGVAIGEFSDFIRTVESVELGNQMRSALGGVTNGLSVAFNTTFLALLFAVPIMLFQSFLRKSQEDLLIQIDEYCLEEVIPHLHISLESKVQSEGYDEHLNKMLQLSENWLTRINPVMEALGHNSQSLSAQISGLQPLVKKYSEGFLHPGFKPQQNAVQSANGLSAVTPPLTAPVSDPISAAGASTNSSDLAKAAHDQALPNSSAHAKFDGSLDDPKVGLNSRVSATTAEGHENPPSVLATDSTQATNTATGIGEMEEPEAAPTKVFNPWDRLPGGSHKS